MKQNLTKPYVSTLAKLGKAAFHYGGSFRVVGEVNQIVICSVLVWESQLVWNYNLEISFNLGRRS